MHAKTIAATLRPLALKDAPVLIETMFPAQKVSFEAQKERKAGPGQTLTSLGSFWKGRKPLILVRAILLGILLPPTDNAEADLAIFEKLMAFDEEGLARRAFAANAFSPKEIANRIALVNPWDYFIAKIQRSGVTEDNFRWSTFPLDVDKEGISLRWKRDISEEDKLDIYRKMLTTFSGYEEKANLCKRPEEVDQDWLYAPVWSAVNRHYAHLGLNVRSFPGLVEQLGILRYGHRPHIGDTFSGGGSIPFEAARLGCDVYASDLNPVACMLTWGALNIIGATPEHRTKIERVQRAVADAVDREITLLGIEHDEQGNRAKAYLYCLETRCPDTGWMVPMAPSWVISKKRNVIARLKPDYANKRYDIEIASGVTEAELRYAEQGTVQDGDLIHELDDKTYRTSIKTLRGDFRLADGTTGNRLRRWERGEFKPRPDDIFQERLYCIQWITSKSLKESRQETYFAAATETDFERERRVEALVDKELLRWQENGFVSDMAIEPGDETTRLSRERGWTYWHHLFTPRHLLILSLVTRMCQEPNQCLDLCQMLNVSSRMCRINSTASQGGAVKYNDVFQNQALNTFYNYAARGALSLLKSGRIQPAYESLYGKSVVTIGVAEQVSVLNDIWITDPPYADAINYHEITEFFIAWLRNKPPKPFDNWVWDSRRALAMKGSGEDFRRDMVAAYKAMTCHMPDNGMQCAMFTHQDTGVWGDLAGIFWGAGLQIVSAWYIATETTSELKKGGYVQGTVVMMLKKRPQGEHKGFKQRLLPAVRQEVTRQIETMMHLNDTVKENHGEPVFNESDLQMGGYAAALKVLTAYTHLGGEDVTTFALRPRAKGEVTVVDEIVQQAAETAASLLVPEGLAPDRWGRLAGVERFILRMLDMETTGSKKLDNYQNFAKAFHVTDYARLMGDIRPNHARLKRVTEFASRDLTDVTELGATRLGRLIIGLQQMLKDTEPQVIVEQLRTEMPDFLEVRPLLVDMLGFIERKSAEPEVRHVAEVLGSRLENLRLGA